MSGLTVRNLFLQSPISQNRHHLCTTLFQTAPQEHTLNMAPPGERDTVPAMSEKARDQRQFEEATTSHAEGLGLAQEAKQASDSEHSMTLAKAIKLYPHAIGWSVLLSSTLIMEGTFMQVCKMLCCRLMCSLLRNRLRPCTSWKSLRQPGIQ